MKRFLLGIASAAAVALLSACGDGHVAPSLRAVHASPDGPRVDILVDGQKIADATYKASTAFQPVSDGTRRVQVNVSGSSPAVTVIDANVATEPGRRYTVFAVDKVARIAPLVVEDQGDTPAAGQVKLRVVHAAPDAPAVDVYVTAPQASLTGTSPTLSFAFKQVVPASGRPGLQVPAGDYRIRVTPAGAASNVIFDSGTVPLAAGADLLLAAVADTGTASPISLLVLPLSGASAELRDSRAQVRVGHFSPNTPAVDAYLRPAGATIAASNRVVAGASFGTATPFSAVTPGSYRASVALAGSTTEALGLDAALAARTAASVFAIGLLNGTGASALRLAAYPDDTAAPATGKAKLRVLHLSPDAPAVDVVALGAGGAIAARLVQNLAFPNASAAYLTLEPGTYTVAVVPTGATTPVLPSAAGTQIQLAADRVYSALAVGCLAVTGPCSGGAPFALTLLTDR